MEAAAVRRNPSVSSPSSGSSAADIDDVETIGGGNTQFRRKSWIVSQFSVDWDWKSILLSMLYGQLLSAVLSGTNIFNVLIQQMGVYPALFPNELVYHCILFISLFRIRHLWSFYRQQRTSLFCWYILMGCIDFSANVVVIKSFENTSSLSVMVITSTSAIFAMFLSMFVFNRRYGLLHLAGTCVVIVGLILINYSKYIEGISSPQGTYWIGTVLAFIAAILYASSNVLEEYVTQVEKGYPIGALGAMGFVGSIVSLIITQGTAYGQADRDSVILNPSPYRWFVSGYVLCMVIFYLAVPAYLQRFSAVRFNFSILTADLFVFVFNKYYLGAGIDGYYIAGFVAVLVGLLVFNLRQPVDIPRPSTRSSFPKRPEEEA